MPSTRTRIVALVCAIATPLLALLVLLSWSLASPVGSSPDDDFHLPSIWCGLGERPGLCEAVGDSTHRRVPAALVDAPCFAFHPDVNASCWNPNEHGMIEVSRANADGLYPPLFYAAMAPFASTNVEASVIAMRVANSVLTVGLLTAVFFALPRRTRPALLVSVFGTSVPLGLFLLPSTNPSSWAVLSACVVWVCVYGAATASGRRQIVLSGLAVIGALIGAGARADAAAFAVFGAVLGLLLGWRRRDGWTHRARWVPFAAGAVIAAVAAVFYLSARQSGAAVDGLSGSTAKLPLSGQVSNVLEIPSLWTGALGQSDLGWLDTRMPAIVWVLSTAVFAGALFLGLGSLGRRRIIALALALLAMWGVPFVLLAQTNALVGTMVQPRYILPLMTIALGVAAARPGAERSWSPFRYGLAALALTMAMSVALHQNMHRYTTGESTGQGIDPGAHGHWWWPVAPSPLVVWAIGSLAFAGLFLLLWIVRDGTARAQASISPSVSDTAIRR